MAAFQKSRQNVSETAATSPPRSPKTTITAEAEIDAESDTDSVLRQLEAELELSSPAPSSLPTSNDTYHNPSSDTPQEPLSTSPTTSVILAARKRELQASANAPPSLVPGRLARAAHRQPGLQEPNTEAALMRATADAPAALVLFYSGAFPTSLAMKDAISALAQWYWLAHSRAGQASDLARNRDGGGGEDEDEDEDGPGTVFLAIAAEKAEWLCRKLGVRVLPCVVGYVAGQEIGRLIGFEGVPGGKDGGWRGVARIVGGWGGDVDGWNKAGSGTLGAKGAEGTVLGERWREWVADGVEDGDGSVEDDGDDEGTEREGRRAMGFVGGGGGGRTRFVSGRTKRGVGEEEEEDEDEEWA